MMCTPMGYWGTSINSHLTHRHTVRNTRSNCRQQREVLAVAVIEVTIFAILPWYVGAACYAHNQCVRVEFGVHNSISRSVSAKAVI